MDPEEVANLTETNPEEQYYIHTMNTEERVFMELFSLVGFLSVIANIIIIFVILKFKKLRTDVTNIIVFHLSLLEAVYLFTTPLTLRVISLIRISKNVTISVYCIFYEGEFILTVTICLFLFLLICDWYIKTYCEEKYVKFSRVYRFFIIAIYIFTIFVSAVSIQLCYGGVMLIGTFLVMSVTYSILVIFLIVMNAKHAFKKKLLRDNKPNVGLVIANIFFVAWCPAIFVTLTMVLGFSRSTFLLRILSLIAFTIGFTSPIFNFLYLFYYVDSFNVFCKRVFRCECNEYGNEILAEQPVLFSNIRLKIEQHECKP